jgi:hypothetical protein
MDNKNLNEILGEFIAELDNGGHFVHVVNTELGLVEAFTFLGKPEEGAVHLEYVKRYLEALRASPEIRRRETTFPIPKECFINSSDNRAYIDRLHKTAIGG